MANGRWGVRRNWGTLRPHELHQRTGLGPDLRRRSDPDTASSRLLIRGSDPLSVHRLEEVTRGPVLRGVEPDRAELSRSLQTQIHGTCCR